MTGVRLFVDGCILQYRALFNWATPHGYAAYKVLLPLTQIAFFAELGRFGGGARAAAFAVVGNALQMVSINGVYGVVQTVANERRYGTLPILLAAPANRAATFLGRALAHILDGMVSVVLGFFFAVFVFHIDLAHTNLPLLALCILIISSTTCGLGLAFGSLALVMRDVFVIQNVVFYALMVLCGVNFPVSLLPGWLQLLGQALPLTRGVQAARQAIAGASLGDVSALLAGEILVGVVYALLGYALFRLLESFSRRGGLQDAF